MAKKTPKKRQKPIDVEHDFDEIIAMAMSISLPEEEKPKPIPKFKRNDKVQFIDKSKSEYIYFVDLISTLYSETVEYRIVNLNYLDSKIPRQFRKMRVKEDEIEKAPE